jgi:hypothetical protein
MSFNLKRDRQRWPVGQVRRVRFSTHLTTGAAGIQLEEVMRSVENHLSQVDAVGQNPDLKGKDLVNIGNVVALLNLDPDTAYSNDQLRDKLIEFIGTLK